jgi:hypothetical protein
MTSQVIQPPVNQPTSVSKRMKMARCNDARAIFIATQSHQH